jgi:hypothetical protein
MSVNRPFSLHLSNIWHGAEKVAVGGKRGSKRASSRHPGEGRNQNTDPGFHRGDGSHVLVIAAKAAIQSFLKLTAPTGVASHKFLDMDSG